MCSAPEVVQEKPGNGLDLEAEEKRPIDLDLGLTEEKPENGLGPMDLGGLTEEKVEEVSAKVGNQSLNQRNLGVVDQEGDGSPEIVWFKSEISVENDYVLAVLDALACPCSSGIV